MAMKPNAAPVDWSIDESTIVVARPEICNRASSLPNASYRRGRQKAITECWNCWCWRRPSGTDAHQPTESLL